MLRNHFKIAIRNLAKRKSYTLINLLGLSLGLASCLIIFLFVKGELSYDQFHSKSDRIFRIAREVNFGGQHSISASTNYSLADFLGDNLKGAERVTRLSTTDGLVKAPATKRQFQHQLIYLVEPSFMEVFDVEFISGTKEGALQGPNQAIITRSTQEKYFGDRSAIGETLTLDNERTFSINAVVEDWPDESHFHPEILVSLQTTRQWYGDQMFEHWGNMWVYTYVLASPGQNEESLTIGSTNVAMEFGPPVLAQFEAKFFAQKVTDIHLDSHIGAELETNGSRTFVQVFVAVGILILLIAGFNFVNLSTARASWRAKEVGLRKVVGADRSQLVGQFLSESVVLTLVACVLAIVLTAIALPVFGDFVGREMSAGLLLDPWLMLFLIACVVVVGVAAGSFPAFYLSGFRPLQVLKGNNNLGDSNFAGQLRKALVSVQFAISIVLVVAAATIVSQLDYVRSMPLGFDKDQVVVLDLYNMDLRSKTDLLKTEISSLSNVVEVGAASDSPPRGLNSWWMKNLDDPEKSPELISLIATDHDFTSALGFEIVEGRNFDADRVTDETSAVILNEAAVKYLGLENPIGTRFDMQEGLKEASVIGVVADFHFSTAREEIQPVMMHIWPRWVDQIFVKVRPGDYQQTIAQIEATWQEVFPDWELSYHFLDQDFDQAYQAEMRFSQMVLTFAGLALAVGVLGLFGLASYVADQKLKELGIRKVLGAAISGMVWIQFRLFIVPLAIALMLSIPIAYYFLQDWLDAFAYRIDLNGWYFAVGAMLTCLVSFSTVGLHAVKAARANPIQSLRNE